MPGRGAKSSVAQGPPSKIAQRKPPEIMGRLGKHASLFQHSLKHQHCCLARKRARLSLGDSNARPEQRLDKPRAPHAQHGAQNAGACHINTRLAVFPPFIGSTNSRSNSSRFSIYRLFVVQDLNRRVLDHRCRSSRTFFRQRCAHWYSLLFSRLFTPLHSPKSHPPMPPSLSSQQAGRSFIALIPSTRPSLLLRHQ